VLESQNITMSGSGTQMPDLTKIPAAPPPPGVKSNFNNPDNYKTQNIILHSIVLSLVTLAVLMRVYTRAFVKKTFGVDDCELRCCYEPHVEKTMSLTVMNQISAYLHSQVAR
jgi:hypothetical protein